MPMESDDISQYAIGLLNGSVPKEDDDIAFDKPKRKKYHKTSFDIALLNRLKQHGIVFNDDMDLENNIAEVVYKTHGPGNGNGLSDVDPIDAADLYAAELNGPSIEKRMDRAEGRQR